MKNYFVITSFVLCLFSCTNKQAEQTSSEAERTISSDTISNTSCPYLTKDNKGNIVMSWVKEVNDSTAFMCYALSKDAGQSFGEITEIKVSKGVHPHSENLPKLLFKPSGEIIAMWGVSNINPKSSYSGLVYYSQSFDEGKTWVDPIALVKDTSAYDQRYFDMELLPNGEAMVIWLDNRCEKEKEGSTLFCAVTSEKNGFLNEKSIGETCCPCCRTDLFIDSKGTIHASYRDIINDSIRDMVQLVSLDNGSTFSQPIRISADNWVINGCPHTGPTVAENKTGLHFAWYTMGGGEGVFYCRSSDFGKTFSERDTVSNNPSAKHPQITALPNGNIAIAWDESVKKGEKVNAWIGLQVRDPEGKIISSKFVSSDNTISEFAVVKAIDEKNILIAYNHRLNERESVTYKMVSVSN
ncbi:MAG TPA: sialidase family protein [Bacteroidia bacterium]|nr:sialidase family protein [Bacteroidia bacterium]